jgi:hypothetical protein
MTSHFALYMLFSLMVSAVFAALQRETPTEQARLGLKLFVGFVAGAYLLGWLMYPFPIGGS